MRGIFYVTCLCILAGCHHEESTGQEETIESVEQVKLEEQVADTTAERHNIDFKGADSTDLDNANADTTVASEQTFADVDWQTFEEDMTKDFSFVILISTKSYDAALERAIEASEKLNYPLNLRELHENDAIGLSFSKEICEEEICGGGLDYPIYIPRSDWGDSKYISIEYSDAFEGFTKGYYIVIAASGEKGAPAVSQALEESRAFYQDAYAKTCGVWMGCGC